MDIVFCTDDKYVMPCGITMISILDNNRDEPITFHVVGLDLKEKSKEKLSSISYQYENASLLFYEIDESILEPHNLSLYKTRYLSLSAYLRLFLTDILPPNLDKVLYLDCDIVVMDSLSGLWNTDIENYSVAGVADICNIYPKNFERLEYDKEYQYINSGVLLINLKYWRDKNLIKQFLDFYKKKQDILWHHDQDIINGVLYKTKLMLPLKYNMIDYNYISDQTSLAPYCDEVIEGIEAPVIIHFTSVYKPWLKCCIHPLKSKFDIYKNKSPWKNSPKKWPDVEISKLGQYYKRRLFYFLRLKKPKYIKVRKDDMTGKFVFNYPG